MVLEVAALPGEFRAAMVEAMGKSVWKCDHLLAPHERPKRLPPGFGAVYIFATHDTDDVLKVGMAGPRSEARFTSQHYLPRSANSSLAAQILRDAEFRRTKSLEHLDERSVGAWMQGHLDRYHIFVEEPLDFMLPALERYLIRVLQPRWEGR